MKLRVTMEYLDDDGNLISESPTLPRQVSTCTYIDHNDRFGRFDAMLNAFRVMTVHEMNKIAGQERYEAKKEQENI